MPRERLRILLALASAEALVVASSLAAARWPHDLRAPLATPIAAAASAPPAAPTPTAPAHPPAHPSPRVGAAMAYDPAHSVVVLFGGAAPVPNAETWTWDGSGWKRRQPSHHPSARSGAAMAFDSAHAALILFGGEDSAGRPLSDTWRWDGSDWSRLRPATAPPPRSGAALVYDASVGRLILFGGAGSGEQRLHDTWSWGGHDWSPAPDSTQPTLDMPGSAAAYDARAGRVLLAGGRGQPQTWAFLAGRWSNLDAGFPAGCDPAAGVYDSALAAPVMVGAPLASPLGVCVWTGRDWQPRPGKGSPPARATVSVAYDDRTGQLVVFGGAENADGRGLLDDTWTWTPGGGWSRSA